MAAHGMSFRHKALQHALRNRVVVKVPAIGVANFYRVRPRCHVDGKRTVVKDTEFFELERWQLRRKRVKVPVQRQPGNAVGHGRQLRHVQHIVGKVAQKAMHQQTVGTRHLEVGQRQIDKHHLPATHFVNPRNQPRLGRRCQSGATETALRDKARVNQVAQKIAAIAFKHIGGQGCSGRNDSR